MPGVRPLFFGVALPILPLATGVRPPFAGVRPPLLLPLAGGLKGVASTAGAAAAAAAVAAALTAAVGVDTAGAAFEGVAPLPAAFLDASFTGFAPALGAAAALLGAAGLLVKAPIATECRPTGGGLGSLLEAHTRDEGRAAAAAAALCSDSKCG